MLAPTGQHLGGCFARSHVLNVFTMQEMVSLIAY